MEILEYGNRSAPLVLIQPVDDHDLASIENEVALIRESVSGISGGQNDFKLVAFKVQDWNRDLSPWSAPAVFGKEGFGGEADRTLDEILKYCTDKSKTYFIGGYSLAGLFALWAACHTDLFRGVAAASPSLWFPNFTDYMKETGLKCGSVYLSLGDKEEKTRNAVMATVGDKIREAYALLKEGKINCTLEWNEGGHFKDADLRTAKAFSWVLKQDLQKA